jgi:D-alanyl-D-alanine carboxypeptidase
MPGNLENVMKNLVLAAAAATMVFAVAPAFANPSQEAEEDYAGWKAAREAAADRATVVHHHNGHVIYRSHHQVGGR